MIQTIQSYVSLILGCANIVVLGYALYKFTKRPRESIEERIKTLESEVENLKESQKQGENKVSAHEKAISALIHSTLALVEFEMQYCLTEHKEMSDSLKKAKEDLHLFLSEK